jgi:hypothetical protein
MNSDHPGPDKLPAPPAADPEAATPEPQPEATDTLVIDSTADQRRAARKALLASGAGLAVLGLVYALTPRGPQRAAPPAAKVAAKPAVVVRPVAVRTAASSGEEDRQKLVESVIRSQKKRIMGRKRSLPDVARVVTLVGPLVARALDQPSLQADLRALADQAGMSLSEYKHYFQHKQEADLLLESGGDPNARSVSDAIGVAQFLAGTARASGGLKVNLPESRRLSWRIARLEGEIAALQALPADWTKPLPGAAPAPVRLASAPSPSTSAGKPVPGEKQPGPRGALASRGGQAQRAPEPAPLPSQPSATPTPSAGETEPNAAQPPSPTPAAGDGAATPAPAPTAEPAEKATTTTETPATGAPANPSAPEPAKPEPTPVPATLPAPRPAPAKVPVITRDELIRKRGQELGLLTAKRRLVDERYDPARAIAAQTRYLVRMTRRYGSLDWVFQAYHGGEGGVRNTVSYYLGSRWQQFGSAECAIRGQLASRGGQFQQVRQPLSFEDLYFKTTPLAQPAAFSYLYGRSDNHRYYWWKILAAERAIALYRRDSDEFRCEWRDLHPGQRLEVVWYPNSKELTFHDVAALKEGYASGKLVHWPADARRRGLLLGGVAPLDPANAYQYKGLRPEALGALFRIAAVYTANGGSRQPLRVHSLVQTEQYRARLNALHPPSWMRYPTKPDEIPIDLEPTGLCFDLERPASDWNRKVLEYALGYLADRNQIFWTEESGQGPRRYHVCPAPDFRRDLARGAAMTRKQG